MPYIAQERRDVLDPYIDKLKGALYGLPNLSIRQFESNSPTPGDLNYCISELLNTVWRGDYRSLNELVGVLECAKLELYRRAGAPLEDRKIVENGDIRTYRHEP